MSCNVNYCRFKNSHVTAGHLCGMCHQYGHGQTECGDRIQISQLEVYLTDTMGEGNGCMKELCTHPNTHITDAHTCSKCLKRHGEKECIIQSLEEHRAQFGVHTDTYLHAFKEDVFMEKYSGENVYAPIPMGQGCAMYVRVKNGIMTTLFLHSDFMGQYGEEVNNIPTYDAFIDGCQHVSSEPFVPKLVYTVNVACPKCNLLHNIDDINDIKGIGGTNGSEQKCIKCTSTPAQKLFSKCGHGIVCEICYSQLPMVSTN